MALTCSKPRFVRGQVGGRGETGVDLRTVRGRGQDKIFSTKEENMVHITHGQAICNFTGNCCFPFATKFPEEMLGAVVQSY